ncbi:unnamed protein product [Bursaphelenchus okinawaensis]|uniref:Major facilitator superfamily (MFS) profile domain-containing protein n=1 Tax=Bursaphelenchus okinawaensis TaxID=465554 RepID=A0A811KPJ7_9BILA|nr:unnamed protein product [Bursaphelenchus okinawaensis]CAG9110264.1 unnamed protein product [Bursaphelenchus okinawaensis]
MQEFWNAMREHGRLVYIVLGVVVLSVAPCGYHMVVLNVPAKTIQEALKSEIQYDYGISISDATLDLLWSLVVSCQSIGALLGCILLLPLESAFGIKNTLLLYSNGILLSGSALFFLSYSFNTVVMMLLGRILIGVYTGLSSALAPMYVAELAPTKIKGSLSCFVHISVCSGAAFGGFFSLESFLGNKSFWNLLLLLPAVFAVIQMLMSRQIPHTPNFFLSKNDTISAAESIKFFYGFEGLSEQELLAKYKSLVTKLPPQLSFRQSLASPGNRRMIFIGMVVSATQILSGSMAAVSYSTSMFESISIMNGLVALFPTLGSILSIVLTLPALKLVETYGRKRLLINTLILCAAANYMLGFFSLILTGLKAGSWASFMFFVAFLVLGVGYNLGTGPVSYFIPGELVTADTVSTAFSVSVATNWTFTLLTTFFYYPVNQAIGGWSYLMFAVPTTLCIWFLNRHLPETKFPSLMNGESNVILACNVLPEYASLEETHDNFNYGAI